MKLLVPHLRNQPQGYALMLVLIFTGISMMMLGGALNWSAQNANMIDRHNQQLRTLAAAEAATEKVLTAICRTYQNSGEGPVYANLANYRTFVPTSTESSHWANYSFNNGAGVADQTYVERISAPAYTNIYGQYAGLYGLAASYRVISNAKETGSRWSTPIVQAVRQDVQVATIPVFQFAIFGTMPLEINPGANMDITGRVHGNSDIYTCPNGTVNLRFRSDVSAVGNIYKSAMTNDPNGNRSSVFNVAYDKAKLTHVPNLMLPIGTNNTAAAVHAILDIPPTSESATSEMGKQRYYNKADLVILVSNSVVKVTSGVLNAFATVIPTNQWTNFISTNVSFYSKREGKTIRTTQIDVGKFRQWSATNTTLRSVIGRDVSAIYVADMRSQSSSTESGVRLVNGQTLPPDGLTVATPNPLYVQGHYNAPASALGTTNTTLTEPASLVGDAITILSSSWNDANASASVSSRAAGDTTVNAAIIAGNVPTAGGYYSGGVENFPRFLETWSGRTLTYNGSMVLMFNSTIATAPWGGADVYSPPNRNWAFDLNFLDASRLPPGTPSFRSLVRGSWYYVPKDTTL